MYCNVFSTVRVANTYIYIYIQRKKMKEWIAVPVVVVVVVVQCFLHSKVYLHKIIAVKLNYQLSSHKQNKISISYGLRNKLSWNTRNEIGRKIWRYIYKYIILKTNEDLSLFYFCSIDENKTKKRTYISVEKWKRKKKTKKRRKMRQNGYMILNVYAYVWQRLFCVVSSYMYTSVI